MFRNREYIISPLLLITSIATLFFVQRVVFAQSDSVMTVAFLDVGQGDSIYIESPSGIQVLIDAGPNKAVLRELSDVMPFWDHSIDVLIATHPDLDHIGGFPEILDRFEVTSLIESGIDADTAAYREVARLVQTENAIIHTIERPQRISLGDGAVLDILFPERALLEIDPNAASLIVRLSYGETSFLFTGDAPVSIEEYVTELWGEELDVDVLKLGHHGSKTSSAESFLSVTSPDTVVISAGANNRYGHPHTEVLERLDNLSIPYLSTAESSTVIFESDGEAVRIK